MRTLAAVELAPQQGKPNWTANLNIDQPQSEGNKQNAKHGDVVKYPQQSPPNKSDSSQLIPSRVPLAPTSLNPERPITTKAASQLASGPLIEPRTASPATIQIDNE